MSLQTFWDPNTVAAISSAVAAIFAAVAAYLSWRTQVHTLRHSFRPEIAIDGWSRVTATEHRPERILFFRLKSRGTDTARQLIINASRVADNNRLTYVSTSISLAGLAADVEVPVEGEIAIFWRHFAQQSTGGKILPVEVIIWVWDALAARQHESFEAPRSESDRL